MLPMVGGTREVGRAWARGWKSKDPLLGAEVGRSGGPSLEGLGSSTTAFSSLRRSRCAPACSIRSASSSLLLIRACSRDACEHVGMSSHSRPSSNNLSVNWEIFSARIPEVTTFGEVPPPARIGDSGAPPPLAPTLDMERSRDMSSVFQSVIAWRWEASRMLASSGRPGGPEATSVW